MPKPETYSVGLLPIAMAAGLLSGGLFRQTPTPEPAKPNPKPAERARDEVLPAGPWLSDLRPVMETIGDAMGPLVSARRGEPDVRRHRRRARRHVERDSHDGDHDHSRWPDASSGEHVRMRGD